MQVLNRACGIVLLWACLAHIVIIVVAASTTHNVTMGCAPLCAAVLKDDVAAARTALEAGVDVHAAHPDGLSSITVAALRGNMAMVDLLRRHGGDLNRPDNGYVPIAVLAARGNVDGIRLLHAAGASLDAPSLGGVTALHVAVEMKQIAALRVLVELAANIDATDGKGWTPLMRAAKGCMSEAAQFLIERGADPIAASQDDQWRPMTLAAREGCLVVVKLLHEVGVDIDTAGADGWTPLVRAASENHLEVVQYLHRAGAKLDSTTRDGQTALLWASFENATVVVEYLLDAGASVNVRDRKGYTPLHLASMSGALKTVKGMLARGADIHSRTGDGSTPLILAARTGRLDVVRHLLDAGASHEGDHNGFNALHHAVEFLHFEVAQALLDAGFDVDSVTLENVTPLHAAAGKGRFDAMQWLLDRGANVDLATKYGATPLITAATRGHFDAMKLLVGRGANIRLRDEKDWSAIQHAEHHKHNHIVAFLRSINHTNITSTDESDGGTQRGAKEL